MIMNGKIIRCLYVIVILESMIHSNLQRHTKLAHKSHPPSAEAGPFRIEPLSGFEKGGDAKAKHLTSRLEASEALW